jgi:hypothetical protein
VMVSSIKPIADGSAWLIYLYNPTSTDHQIALRFDPAIRVAVQKSDPFGKVVDSSADSILIAAQGSLYVRVDRVK